MRRAHALLAAALLLAGCAAAGEETEQGTERGTETLRVFAAASLAETFETIGELYEEEHGVAVELNLAGSSDLVTQLENGAPADVFAAADEATMERAVDAGLVAEAVIFTANTLVIVTPPENPTEVGDLADLGRPDVLTVVCAPQVPCGAATGQVTEAAGVTLAPTSEESAVTDVLGKVVAGEADAGLVYRTDALGAGEDVLAIEFPEAAGVVNRYPIAPLQDSAAAEHAQAFVDLVTGPEGQAILERAGFTSP